MGNMRKLLKRSLIQRLNTLRLYVLLAPKSPSANVARYRIFFAPRKTEQKVPVIFQKSLMEYIPQRKLTHFDADRNRPEKRPQVVKKDPGNFGRRKPEQTKITRFTL